jgi:lambda repressor-like predicted transcriptional regulator
MNLEAARLNQGLSLPDAAAQIGISRGTLVKAERGDSVHPRQAKLIADFYKVRVTDIWPVEEVAA